jgi:hypothetical protein
MTFDDGVQGLAAVDETTATTTVVGFHGAGDLNGADFVPNAGGSGAFDLIAIDTQGNLVRLDTQTGASTLVLTTVPPIAAAGVAHWRCAVDLDGDGSPTLFDFLAFQNLFDAGDLAADFDGDGSLTIFDFLAFQSAFAIGCP